MSEEAKERGDSPEEAETQASEDAEEGSEFTVPDPEEEGVGGTLPPNPDLEAALREATEAVEARDSERAAAGEEKPPEWVELEEELASLRAQHEDLERQHLRLQADFENVRRRALKERQENHNYGHEGFAKDLLGTVDNLERAIEHARKPSGESDSEAMIEGVELVHRELIQVLERFHVEAVEAEGQPFDPSVHEAMAQHESAEVPPNTVVQVFARGYLLRDRLLRPAKVIVSKAPADTTEK